MGLVIASMTLCWLPLHAHNALRAMSGGTLQFPAPLYHTAIALSHAHSALDPLIYALVGNYNYLLIIDILVALHYINWLRE